MSKVSIQWGLRVPTVVSQKIDFHFALSHSAIEIMICSKVILSKMIESSNWKWHNGNPQGNRPQVRGWSVVEEKNESVFIDSLANNVMNDDGVERWKAINSCLCGATAETWGGTHMQIDNRQVCENHLYWQQLWKKNVCRKSLRVDPILLIAITGLNNNYLLRNYCEKLLKRLARVSKVDWIERRVKAMRKCKDFIRDPADLIF